MEQLINPNTAALPLRSVPLTLQLRLLLGSFIAQLFGWFWLGFSLIFFWSGTCESEVIFPSLLHFTSDISTGNAVLTAIKKTGHAEGGSDTDSGRPILAYEYVLSVAGVPYSGVSYDFGGGHRVGDSVRVEYVNFYPSSSRIIGMRVQPVPYWVGLMILPFLIIGQFFIRMQWSIGRKQIRLLREGIFTTATFVSESTYDDDGTTYLNMVYQFSTPEGQVQEVQVKTSRRMRDQELVVYLPTDPATYLVVDKMDVPVSFSEEDELLPGSLVSAIVACLIPAAVIAGNLAYLWNKVF